MPESTTPKKDHLDSTVGTLGTNYLSTKTGIEANGTTEIGDIRRSVMQGMDALIAQHFRLPDPAMARVIGRHEKQAISNALTNAVAVMQEPDGLYSDRLKAMLGLQTAYQNAGQWFMSSLAEPIGNEMGLTMGDAERTNHILSSYIPENVVERMRYDQQHGMAA